MKKSLFFIIIMLIIANRPANSAISTHSNRKLLPAYIDASKRHSMGLSVPLRWAPEAKAWQDRIVAGLPLRGQVNPYTSIKERSILIETETPQIPQETAVILYFEVGEVIYSLLPQTYEHIKEEHDIDDPSSFIEDVLLNYVKAIDNSDGTKRIYYKHPGGHIYEVVVVGIGSEEIEDAFVSDEKPKPGDF